MAARNGQTQTRDGEIVGRMSAASLRASALRAYRRHESRIAAGHDDEESAESEAGAILDAETAGEIHGLHEMFKAWLEAQK